MQLSYGQFLTIMKALRRECSLPPSVAIDLTTARWHPQRFYEAGDDTPLQQMIHRPIPHNDNVF